MDTIKGLKLMSAVTHLKAFSESVVHHAINTHLAELSGTQLKRLDPRHTKEHTQKAFAALDTLVEFLGAEKPWETGLIFTLKGVITDLTDQAAAEHNLSTIFERRFHAEYKARHDLLEAATRDLTALKHKLTEILPLLVGADACEHDLQFAITMIEVSLGFLADMTEVMDTPF